jgi:type IV pilus assembly protein PilW
MKKTHQTSIPGKAGYPSTSHKGMTLIELMVAMTIGSVLMVGALTVYTQSRANYQTADSIARLQENLRFALDTLEPDVRLAQFWGLTNEPLTIQTAGVQVSCAGADNATATDLALGLGKAVEGFEDPLALGCSVTDARANSDVLVVRHASARTATEDAGQVQIISDTSGGILFDNGIKPAGRDPEAQVRDVIANAYYVSNTSQFSSAFDSDLPSLRRLSLVKGPGGGVLQDQEIIPGVENLQVQFGVDTDGNNEVDRYVDSDHDMVTEGAAGFLPDAQIIAVRLWLLVRSETNETGQAFKDEKTYATPDADFGPISPAADADYPQEFRRMALSTTIYLRNVQLPQG